MNISAYRRQRKAQNHFCNRKSPELSPKIVVVGSKYTSRSLFLTSSGQYVKNVTPAARSISPGVVTKLLQLLLSTNSASLGKSTAMTGASPSICAALPRIFHRQDHLVIAGGDVNPAI